jgi:lipoyl(octanoyl) transferase
MDPNVRQFAERLRAHAHRLGPMETVEWNVALEPVDYLDAIAAMEARVAEIRDGLAAETIWLLEHPPLYTAGTSARADDLLEPERFPVYAAGRGGQYTYHGPGQLVAYVMFDLERRGRDIRCHVHRLEDWVMAALLDYNVCGERRRGHPGIWISTRGRGAEHTTAEKIAAIGVRVRRWVTYHGVAVNVCPELEHFSGIVPCGIADAGVTSLKALGRLGEAVGLSEVSAVETATKCAAG